MQAFAAEKAGEAAAHGGSMLENPTLWVALAFVTLLVLAGKKIYLMAGTALDERSEGIKAKLDEAARLREEAQEILASNRRKQQEAAKEAEAFVVKAKEEAERIRDQAAQQLERDLERRKQLAEERISQAETRAIAEIRTLAADVALAATQQILKDGVTAKKAEGLINDAIKELPAKFN